MNASLSDDEISKYVGEIKDLIERMKGEVVSIEKWGKRQLAYEVKKQTLGYYVLVLSRGEHSMILEFERRLKISDSVIKFMTVNGVESAPLIQPKPEFIEEEEEADSGMAEGLSEEVEDSEEYEGEDTEDSSDD